jgi:FAD/FMN-containing dehydrogenase
VAIDRRRFLKALGVGASVAALPGALVAAGRPDWAALRAKVAGGVLLPGDAGYDAARRAYDTLFDGNKPAAVARCTRPEDVQACVEFARAAGLRIAARSGGHSYAGYSTPTGGLVVDLAGMRSVQARADGTAVVGAGARLIDVDAALAGAGRCLPAGSCPTVGVAGLTLGGGIGVLARRYGLTCDKLVAARVVTADGRLLTASEASEPDLFWALRGGGGGNFGIVTSFTFATEPASKLTVFSIEFPSGSAAAVVGAWQDWVAAAPDALWSNCVLRAGSPPAVRVGGCFVGTPATLRPLLADLVTATGTHPDPADQTVTEKGYLAAMRYFAGCSAGELSECRLKSEGGKLGRAGFVAASAILAGPIAQPAKLVALLAGRTRMDLLLDSLGGAVARLAPGATAFPHRTALASAQIYAGTDAAGRAKATKAVAEVRAGLQRLVGGRAYVNYIDPRQPGWGGAYYGANLGRLREVARRYDPDRVFDFPQGVARA